ncbi:MAG: choice-of-anchor M domain-containing protein, partial [Bifidobacteriaceae bacterium]|nr:choice-of-anchor M domain-containing protein [Bifidobacteriaceae bacterium]
MKNQVILRNTMRKIQYSILAILCVISLLLTPSAHASENNITSEHKPGVAGHSVHIDENTTIAGTNTLHPCAGRNILYQSHVDATYVTRNQGKLAIMSVNGTEVVNPNTVCIRLPQDAINGKEVSRMVVPNDSALSFLGAPGRILWHAPMQLYDNWKPIWAGFGAFDPSHEWQVPTDFVGNTVQIELTDVQGPGDVEVFNYQRGWQQARRYFSSHDNITKTTTGVGGHGHTDWTFSQPGIYKLTWKAHGLHFDGTRETSEPMEQYWLVGSDEQVGLPAGTTTKLSSISYTAEQYRSYLNLTEPEEDYIAPQPVNTDVPDITEEEAEKLVKRKLSFATEDTIISSNSAYATFTRDNNSLSYVVKDNNQKEYGEYPIIEVPDSTLTYVDPNDSVLHNFIQRTNNTWLWLTPAQGNDSVASFGIDTGLLPYDQFGNQKTMYEASISGPNGSNTLIGLNQGKGFMPITDSGSQNSKNIQLLSADKHNLQYAFSKPGVYSINGTMSVFLSNDDNEQDYTFTGGYFVVGNKTINALRKKINPDATLL